MEVKVRLNEAGDIEVRDDACDCIGGCYECRLIFTAQEWNAFIAGVKAGEFDFNG